MQSSRIVLLSWLCVATLAFSGARPATLSKHAESIAPNDNTHSAGRLDKGVLTVSLEARTGEWRPEESAGPAIPVAAFAVVGGSLQTPGPLLRAPVGTEIRVTMHNALTVPMWVYGLGEKHGYADSVQLAAGATHDFRFRATTPGISYYAARTTTAPVIFRATDDSQLNGAIVIDPPNAPPDRIFVISEWFTLDSTTVSGLGPISALAFNGLGWPYTPRIDMSQGDTVHWRVVNVTGLEHPLHLHGSFFRVDAKGDGQADTVYAPEDRRMAVTELVRPGQTMDMTWTPRHSGNWVFHCHIASHATKREYFEADRAMPAHMDMDRSLDHLSHMGGLVIGIRVRARGPQEAELPVSQQIRLLVRSRANVYGKYVGYGFVRGDSPAAAMRDSFSVPGPTLELTRGKRVAITVVNQSHEAAAVHWHGIELESSADGVPGWSGFGKSVTQFIMPGDSLTVKFTPPRSGTFMYHSHSNEMQEISSGLYGAIIVRDPGPRPDSSERTLLLSDGGPMVNFIKRGPPVLLNGKLMADTIDVPAGVPTRLRLINIRSENATQLSLERDGTAVTWRAVAKDGADLPAHQRREMPAQLVSEPGEIYDYEITPSVPGIMVLRYLGQVGDTTTTQRAIVRVLARPTQ
ncbi:MAG: multicopper oxidase domain-containing protein [Gemmatimonadales bacterium]|jgi:FtsP/CotA-like multicopper oxidase with cupredoxin domain